MHWNGKLIPVVSGSVVGSVDRLPVMVTSTVDGSTKLLRVLESDLPSTVIDMCIPRTFFDTIGIDTSFLSVPVDRWCETQSYMQVLHTAICHASMTVRSVVLP